MSKLTWLFSPGRAGARRVVGVGVLDAPRQTVPSALKDTRTAIANLETVDDDLGLLHSRRLAELLADLTEGALLVEHAAWSLARDGDAGKALVARGASALRSWRRHPLGESSTGIDP